MQPQCDGQTALALPRPLGNQAHLRLVRLPRGPVHLSSAATAGPPHPHPWPARSKRRRFYLEGVAAAHAAGGVPGHRNREVI